MVSAGQCQVPGATPVNAVKNDPRYSLHAPIGLDWLGLVVRTPQGRGLEIPAYPCG